jgi:DNA-binding NarL/FixJ family response regulator
MQAASILMIEDHPIFLDGLRCLFATQDDLQVAGEASTISDALVKVQVLRPALALLDLGLCDGYGLELLPRIREESPNTRVLVLTAYGQDHALPALRMGARGFVCKDTASSHLLDAVRAVLRGELWAPRRAAGQFIDELLERDRRRDVESSLTPREMEVLYLIGEGRRNADIARTLFISENTVKTHVASLMRKLEIDDRIRLTLYASRNQLEIDDRLGVEQDGRPRRHAAADRGICR